MAEEKLICVNCGGEVRTDIEQAEDAYWCDGCNHFVPVRPKARNAITLCRDPARFPTITRDVFELAPHDSLTIGFPARIDIDEIHQDPDGAVRVTVIVQPRERK